MRQDKKEDSMSRHDFSLSHQRDVEAVETRSRQSSVMVGRSHVTTEFNCVATGNGHYASNKLVAIRYSPRDRGALLRTIGMRAIGMHTLQRRECDKGILS